MVDLLFELDLRTMKNKLNYRYLKGVEMKKIIIIVFFLLTAVILLSQPIIEFETLVYDFGRIKEEEGPHKVDFKFSNTGNESFRIINVHAG